MTFLAVKLLKITQNPAKRFYIQNSPNPWKNMVRAGHNLISVVCPAQFSFKIFGDLADQDKIWPGSDWVTHAFGGEIRGQTRFTVELISELKQIQQDALSNIWKLERREKARISVSDTQWFITVSAGGEAGDQEKETSGRLRSSHPPFFGTPTLWWSRK